MFNDFIIFSTASAIKLSTEIDLKRMQDKLNAENLSIQSTMQEIYRSLGIDSTAQTNSEYISHIFYLLLEIEKELAKSDDFPVTVNEAKKITNGMRKLVEYGLKPVLLSAARCKDAMTCLCASVTVLVKLIHNKHFSLICTLNDQKMMYTHLLTGLFVIISGEDQMFKTKFEAILLEITANLPHSQFFEILFLIKGNSELSQQCQKVTHKQLLQCLYRPGSFVSLCEALLLNITSTDQDENTQRKRLHCCTVISKIIAHNGYSKKFFHMIIDEIHHHLISFINNNQNNQQYYADIGVYCLVELWSLQHNFIQKHIIGNILERFDRLVTPEDLLTGSIVFDEQEFRNSVSLLHLTFCAFGLSNSSLPSNLLVPYLPLLFQLHNAFNSFPDTKLNEEITSIVVRCLANRETSHLNEIIEHILYEDYSSKMKKFHSRIKFHSIVFEQTEHFRFQIAAEEDGNIDFDVTTFYQSSVTLVNLLKQSNHNVLIYNVFLHLLQMLSDNFISSETIAGSKNSAALVDSVDELTQTIEKKFKKKYAIINTLNELILYKPFHSQFSENPHHIIDILNQILNRQIEHIEMIQAKKCNHLEDDNEEILIVILSIVSDFLQKIRNDDLKLRLHRTIQKLRQLLQTSKMETVLRKLNNILEPEKNILNSDYFVAKSMLTDSNAEPYTKVFGIMTMIKLIKAKDEETLANVHSVLALAMKLLIEDDSYIFLNCIKLLIALGDILSDTVIESLVAEYHLDMDECSLSNIDFKLKIGETIVKVTQGLGEMCYKYKDALINGFLRGSCHSNDEFRTSNISNLGTLLRILSYQIHHFFEEVRKQFF